MNRDFFESQAMTPSETEPAAPPAEPIQQKTMAPVTETVTETTPSVEPIAPISTEPVNTAPVPQATATPEAPQTPAATTPALPEGDPPEPPRPLVAGAFLGGEFEVKDLVARGLTNYYLAFGGDYSAPLPKLVAEREAPHSSMALPTETSTESAVEKPALASALFPPAQFVTAPEREYLIYDWSDTIALQDWREAANDARYLQAISTLVAGMRELESKNLRADFTRETLRFDANGDLKYFGFVDAQPENQSASSSLESLRETNAFLLRQVFGQAATIRLDDQWAALAMSEEVKKFSRSLEQEYSNLEEAEAALQLLISHKVLLADAALLTDVGQEREVNEDGGMIARFTRGGHEKNFDVELYVVSDGMGGHEGGEVASDLTLSTLHDAIARRTNLDWNDNVQVRAALGEVIEEVNAAVVALTESDRYRATRAKPGATLTFALRIGPRVFFGNVGDSRAYKWSARAGLQRVTKDHSYVQTLIDAGEITEEQAFEHPDGSIITAHIGMQKLKQRDIFLRLVAPGDKILIVSDGVIDMLREAEFEPFLHLESPHEICRKLVDASNEAGGHDNITVVCVNFS